MVSELALLECLVVPLRQSNLKLARAYEDIFQSAEVNARPVDSRVVLRAAELRARAPALRTPDAIQLATAQKAGCQTFITNDKRIGGSDYAGLSLIFLDDLLTP